MFDSSPFIFEEGTENTDIFGKGWRVEDEIGFFSNKNTNSNEEIENFFSDTNDYEEKITYGNYSSKQNKLDLEEKENDDELNETSLSGVEDGEIDKVDKTNLNEMGIPNSNYEHKESDIFIIKKVKKYNRNKQKRRKKIVRKNDADTMRRKIKPYFHKYILDFLNGKIKLKRLFKDKRLIFLKMNNKMTSTVSIKMNRNLIGKTIKNILKTERISSKYKSLYRDNNSKLVELISKKNDPEINVCLNKTYREMYYEFLNSEKFKDLLEKIKNKDGIDYMKKFNDVSQEFICYFCMTEPKKDKHKKSI